jgi:Fe2+ transport system protein B
VRNRCAACGKGKQRRRQCGIEAPQFKIHACPGAATLSSLGVTELIHLYDTPGSATLAANGEDEIVARDLILSGEMTSVLLVADAKNLRRSVALFLEMAELGLPMTLSLNMLDEAEAMGVEVDDQRLSRELGVPVVRTIAVEKQGLKKLAEQRPERPECSVRFPNAIEEAIARMEPLLATDNPSFRGLAVLLLSRDAGAAQWVEDHLGKETLQRIDQIVEAASRRFATPLKELISNTFFSEAKQITDRVMIDRPEPQPARPIRLFFAASRVRHAHRSRGSPSGLLMGRGLWRHLCGGHPVHKRLRRISPPALREIGSAHTL